ncbi:hypothetical protein B0T18DRAFT_410196 [Schizothecium vesticola]|uniref:Uncharacterized protein n=1 Tax=Schizothecium vesticola TaxID=314040 RepID=A0AA40K4X9_9PEZI|nr:hypothetical protein B0T18DRAFT_410196 [Schizothecium vesticola]
MAVSPFGPWPLSGDAVGAVTPLPLYPPMRGRWATRQSKSISSHLPLVPMRASAGPRLCRRRSHFHGLRETRRGAGPAGTGL